ncbi:hypothetical protein [Candidatus Nitrosocosmicus sp. R]
MVYIQIAIPKKVDYSMDDFIVELSNRDIQPSRIKEVQNDG